MNVGFTFPVLHNAVDIMTPLLLASLGGLLTEMAGMLNIALEGLMLLGAFFGILFSFLTGSLFWGVLLGALVTMGIALIFGAVTIFLKANVFITGLATNLMAAGLTTVLSHHILANKGVVTFPGLAEPPRWTIRGLEGVPVLGDILLGHGFFTYLSWLFLGFVLVLIYATPFGFRLRGAGKNPAALRALGLHPRRYQLIAFGFSGLACALAGASLSLNIGAYVPNISSGRGWTALVILYLGNKTPLGILGAALFFALAESFSNWVQGAQAVPADFVLALPYLITLAVMVGASVIKYRRSSRKKQRECGL